MQNAHLIIRRYHRKRILVCVAVALLTLTTTLGLRFISQRSLNQQSIDAFTHHAVSSLDRILLPIAARRDDLLALVGQPCEQVHLPLRKQAAALQTLRSVALVSEGMVYCSSVFGARNTPLQQLQPVEPSGKPQLFLSTDNSLLKGTPILIQWFPSADSADDGVMLSINISLLGRLLLEPQNPLITRISVNIGQQYFTEADGVTRVLPAIRGEQLSGEASQSFPFSISVSGPGATRLALADLPSQLPLALVLTLLMTGIAWAITAGRMSFSREINLGIAGREFILYCQPLINAQTHVCAGVEILLRWNNPRLGWISPEVFVPLAENDNQIAALTRYVIAETVRQIAVFPSEPGFHIGINVAASHFQHGALLRDLNRYWFRARPPQQLVLELTERDTLKEVNDRLVRELHRKGVLLAIDDFGTGSSALSWLEQLHPDVLKIDQSFTRAIGTDAVNSTVIDMIIALGQRLNISLVAEGVETPQQAHYLRRHGVHLLQGFLYARPMPLAEFPGWLAGSAPPPAAQNGHHRPVMPA